METPIVGQRSSTLVMHRQSRTISKSKPKIRIIHIFAPEIIKTDVANFRELVQRLTGKPDDSENHHHQKGPKKNRREDHHHHHDHQVQDMNKKPSFFTTKKRDFQRAFCTNAEAEEGEGEEMRRWSGNGESSGGFLNGLGDFDGFIQDLGEFPLLPF